MGRLNYDPIKRLLTLTSDYIKRLHFHNAGQANELEFALYLESTKFYLTCYEIEKNPINR